MRIAIAALAVLVNLWISAAAVAAEDVSSMQIMSGMPNMGQGQWTINVLEGGGGMPKTASVCLDSLAQMARGPGMPGRKPGAQAEQRSECTSRVIENTSSRGVVESTCPDAAMRTTITRDGAKAFLMHAERIGKGEPYSMKARYSYDGPCEAGGPAVTMDKDSEQCRKMRAMAGMDPTQMCANAGANRQMCEEQMRRSLAQMQAMCQ
ncbi:MAG: hypothetical protein OEN48_15975 [Betaproteobacteria bacterium]|nr:hypothetical protein [Gammaproteobacteria bacterium]MDH3438471.1 hypothetical protein [Betaproteobacteria bacterium]